MLRMTSGSSNPSGAAALVSTAFSLLLVDRQRKTRPPPRARRRKSDPRDGSRRIQIVRLSSVSRIRRGASPPSAATMNAARGMSVSTNTTSRPLGIHAGRRPSGAIRAHGTTLKSTREEATAVIFGTKDETLAIGRPGRLRLVSRRTRHPHRVAAVDALHPDVEVPVSVPRVGYPTSVR